MGWDERFDRGVELFNTGEFFDAHEVWEDLWHEVRDADRDFLQALIQIAAGLYHLDCGNTRGARSQLTKAAIKLGRYVPRHRSIVTDTLLTSITSIRDAIGTPEASERSARPTLERPIDPTPPVIV